MYLRVNGVEAKIFFQEFKLLAHIGILEHEIQQAQTIIIDIEFNADITVAARTDDIKQALDYVEVKTAIETIVNRQHYNLLETLASEIVTQLTQQFAISALELSIRKPEIFADMQAVGIKLSFPSFSPKNKN